jgi:hypothetical protein
VYILYLIFQVCANGLVCFNRSYESYLIPENRQYRFDLNGIYCLAPYFRDLDLRSSGSVWYQAYNMSSDAENIRESMKNLVHETYSIQITPSFIFKATWMKVPLFGRPSHEVCMEFMFLYKKLQDYLEKFIISITYQFSLWETFNYDCYYFDQWLTYKVYINQKASIRRIDFRPTTCRSINDETRLSVSLHIYYSEMNIILSIRLE